VAAGEVTIGVASPSLSAAMLGEMFFGHHEATPIAYASDHPRQVMDLIWPSEATSAQKARREGDGGAEYTCCVFVHGGAWCWGERFHYMSAGRTLADALQCPVLVPSYRSYPHGDAAMMACDVSLVLRWAAQRFGNKTLLAGHSAGATLSICALCGLAGAPGLPPIPGWVPSGGAACRGGDAAAAGVSAGPQEDHALLSSVRHVAWFSGVADVGEHYAFEAARTADVALVGRVTGVEKLSPMCPATGGPRRWHGASAKTMLRAVPEGNRWRLPMLTLLHGTEDATVPLTSTLGLRRVAAACGLRARMLVLHGCDHTDTLLPLMARAFSRRVKHSRFCSERGRGGGQDLRTILLTSLRLEADGRESHL
jgi:hypothetical protein